MSDLSKTKIGKNFSIQSEPLTRRQLTAIVKHNTKLLEMIHSPLTLNLDLMTRALFRTPYSKKLWAGYSMVQVEHLAQLFSFTPVEEIQEYLSIPKYTSNFSLFIKHTNHG